jgi:hypothetical protein
MNQPIAGVTPVELEEVPTMTVWPSVAAYNSGRFLGRLYEIRWPNVYIFRLGNLLVLLSIPHALFLYFLRIAPVVGQRYTVTNRRVVVQRGLSAVDEREIALDQFDQIEVDVLSGQEWFHAGDLVFRREDQEVFRLEGVSRPETFRRVCLNSHLARTGVQQARDKEAAVV